MGGTDTGNWNGYEGAADKPLTKEEKKAKNAAEDAASAGSYTRSLLSST